MRWSDYVREVIGDDQQVEAARKSGLDQTAISRWLKNDHVPKPELAARFARAYNRPVIEAFVAAGFLTPEEAKERPTAPPSLDGLSSEQLLDELGRRVSGGRKIDVQVREVTVLPPPTPIRSKPDLDALAQPVYERLMREAEGNPQGALSLIPHEPDSAVTQIAANLIREQIVADAAAEAARNLGKATPTQQKRETLNRLGEEPQDDPNPPGGAS